MNRQQRYLLGLVLACLANAVATYIPGDRGRACIVVTAAFMGYYTGLLLQLVRCFRAVSDHDGEDHAADVLS